MSDAHLKLTDVTRHYGDAAGAVRVLQGANLTVMAGELVALVAPSGAGKSTLLHVSGLLERPQQGEVEIMGLPTAAMGDRQRTLLRRTTVGYVYQFHHLLPEFTALENVTMPQLIAGVAPRRPISARWNCWSFWVWPSAPATVPPSFRGANSSAWPLPGRRPTVHVSFWLTSRRAISTHRPATRCLPHSVR